MAANVTPFKLSGHRSLQRSGLVTTTGSFSTAISPSPDEARREPYPPSYEPCLLLKYELVPFFDDGSSDSVNTVSYTFYSLKEKKIIKKKKEVVFPTDTEYLLPVNATLVGSSHGWLAYTDGSLRFYLTNPSMPLHCTQILWVDYFSCSKKIAFSSAPKLESDPSGESTVNMVSLDDHGRPDFIDFDCVNRRSKTVECISDKYYEDIVYFSKHGKYYGLQYSVDSQINSHGRDEDWKPSSILGSPTRIPIGSRYLAECSGNLLSCGHGIGGFEVHKFNFELQEFEPVKSLGDDDEALFLGKNHAFTLCTREYPYLRKNCVYTARNIYNLEDGSVDNIDIDREYWFPSSFFVFDFFPQWLMVDIAAI